MSCQILNFLHQDSKIPYTTITSFIFVLLVLVSSVSLLKFLLEKMSPPSRTTRNSATNESQPNVLENKKMKTLSEEGKLIVSMINEHIDQVMKTNNEMMSDRIDQLMKANNDRIVNLETTINKMQKRMNLLEQQIDNYSSYERRDTLVLSGSVPVAHRDENCVEIVKQLLKDQTRLIINSNDISTAHRLGRKPDNSNEDKRSIIFKLCRRDIKRDIVQACRNHKPNFYINEHLTPTRGTIMFVLRKARQMNSNKIGTARSNDGSISVNLPADEDGGRGKRVICNTRASLDELLRTQLNVTSDRFVKNWPEV